MSIMPFGFQCSLGQHAIAIRLIECCLWEHEQSSHYTFWSMPHGDLLGVGSGVRMGILNWALICFSGFLSRGPQCTPAPEHIIFFISSPQSSVGIPNLRQISRAAMLAVAFHMEAGASTRHSSNPKPEILDTKCGTLNLKS